MCGVPTANWTVFCPKTGIYSDKHSHTPSNSNSPAIHITYGIFIWQIFLHYFLCLWCVLGSSASTNIICLNLYERGCEWVCSCAFFSFPYFNSTLSAIKWVRYTFILIVGWWCLLRRHTLTSMHTTHTEREGEEEKNDDTILWMWFTIYLTAECF